MIALCSCLKRPACHNKNGCGTSECGLKATFTCSCDYKERSHGKADYEQRASIEHYISLPF